MAITSAFKQYQRNFSPAQSLSDIGITAGVEGLPGRMEAPLAAAPLQQKVSRDTGGGAMMPGATNIMLTQMPFSTPQQQQQVTNLFAGAQFNFPVVQPAKTVGATYNITQAAPFDIAAYLKSLDTGTKVKNGKVKNGKVKNGKVTDSKDSDSRARQLSLQAALGATTQETKAQYGGYQYQLGGDDEEVQELMGQGVDRGLAKAVVERKKKEKKSRDKNPIAELQGKIAAKEANIARSKAANERIAEAKAANKRNPANKYGVGTFRTTPGVGRGYSGGF